MGVIHPLVSPTLLARGFGQGTDFEVYTGAAKSDEPSELPVIRMIGSSTIKDLQGDIMTLHALEDMTKIDPEMTIFVNHKYDLPDDVFGKLYGKPEIRMSGGIADLHLAAIADLSRDEPGRYPHSRAWDTYTQIAKGKIRQGCSVGCQVNDYTFLDPDDYNSPILINSIYTVEFSIVGIPANIRAWVENAIKGLFERTLIEGRGDEALRLAPAVKGMFWRDYENTLRYIESKSLRTDLERTPARSTHPQRIIYNFDSVRAAEGFALHDRVGVIKALSRDEADNLIETGAPLHLQTAEEGKEEEDMGITKAVSGKTSWPLMDIGTEWTGSKAEGAIFAYAKGDDGEIVPSKAKQGFLYFDTAKDPKTKGAYKMPFTYGGEGGLKIVPLGVRACAGALSGGGREVSASAEDKSGMKAKCKTMYGRINSQFKPDPPWVVPWEKDEKSYVYDIPSDIPFVQDGDHEPIRIWHTHAHQGFPISEPVPHYHEEDAQHTAKSLTLVEGHTIKGVSTKILDTTSGSDLIRQDLDEGGSEEEEEVDKKDKGIEIGSDGSHGSFTGKHSHSHKAYGDQGSDELHDHEHSHDGDGNHGHDHAEKSAEKTIDKQAGVKLDEDGNHDDFTGNHTHKHKAFGADDANDDKMHSHEHEHDGDSQHKHPHDAESQKAGDVVINDDGSHEKITAEHTHKHPNYGAKADGSMHNHSHEHQNDNDHHHHEEQSDEKHLTINEQRAAQGLAPITLTEDPVQLAYLAMYNEIGVKLGFPIHTLTTKCDLVPTEGDAGIVRSTLTALDDCTDDLEELAERIDGYVDALMGMTGTPDMDDGMASSPISGLLYSLRGVTTKEGRTLNTSNRGMLQTIHDCAMSMHPDVCKGQQSSDNDEGDDTARQSHGISVEEALEQARAMGQGSEQMVMSLQGLTKALDGINVASIQEEVGALKTASVALQKSVETLQKEERLLLERQDQLKREQDALMGNVAKLKNMPLGRPTGLNRSVVDVERMTIPPATYEEMLAAGGTTSLLDTKITLREALEQTQIVEVDIVQSSGKLAKTKKRRWPAGLGVDVRPPLTGDQKSMMRLDEWDAYAMGSRIVDVPLIDDPAESLVS